MRIRPAVAADRDWLRSLHQEAYAVLSGRLYDSRARAWEAGFFTARIAHPVDLFIIEADGGGVGAVYIEDRPESVFVESLEVLPDHQGRGAGSFALKWVVRRAASAGQPVTLQVHKVNSEAQRLYAKLGFEVIGETETHQRMRSK
ncbi:GNAT family N-acetyltransferase [Propionicimonas sp.]|nr:GNAT family N-acetyltransferase [Propionicimonas sp.]MBU3987594.1 GNAT family N-acetyltransferase [Actinomycetota bacterium]MBU4006461.1 GNAT family N-acetyltransferase [Actinomycetota bacterium]MBU4066651.1 GNAT family N-acetyltransferase [Actinomycetota bacterium]MBU4094606.1 GNAT family N-acetyltransferase [Actinomycetota bacterium]MBU4188259.1 GNAT family N-acetyltransferase [Actinomycetota bacterium]